MPNQQSINNQPVTSMANNLDTTFLHIWRPHPIWIRHSFLAFAGGGCISSYSPNSTITNFSWFQVANPIKSSQPTTYKGVPQRKAYRSIKLLPPISIKRHGYWKQLYYYRRGLKRVQRSINTSNTILYRIVSFQILP